MFIQLAKWLINEKKMNVFVEEKTLSDSDFDENNEFPLIKSKPWSGLSFCRFLEFLFVDLVGKNPELSSLNSLTDRTYGNLQY